MSLNIKNQNVHELATQLSQLTGETLTGVILVALEDRLKKEQKKLGRPKAEQILEFAARFAPGVDPALRSTDHGEILYDSNGLPR